MAALATFFDRVPSVAFEGIVHRICIPRFRNSPVSMRGAFLHGGRYNVRNFFGCLYTSLELETAQREVEQYFTVPPDYEWIRSAIRLKLSRVVDLTDEELLREAGLRTDDLVSANLTTAQQFGQRAWERGVEALLVPSAVSPDARNLAVFLDNQRPGWQVELTRSGVN